MKSVFVYLDVKPECREKFEQATLNNHKNSVNEEGNIRFDVLHSKDDPDKYSLYEIWESDEALARHKTTDHYLGWAAVLPECLKTPRSKTNFDVIGLTDTSRKK